MLIWLVISTWLLAGKKTARENRVLWNKAVINFEGHFKEREQKGIGIRINIYLRQGNIENKIQIFKSWQMPQTSWNPE